MLLTPSTMPIPLPTLLSHALVAFTIEFDNEFEHRMPHRTTNFGPTAAQAPWLVSMAMWSTCMRFVGEEGISVATLEAAARTKTNLNGMRRWGYVTVSSNLIRATPQGRQAQEIWRTLFAEIEQRWRDRFGRDEIEKLCESLSALNTQMNLDLPDCLPILGHGLFSAGPHGKPSALLQADGNPPLPTLLSRVLLAFAIEYENESKISLAIAANVLRVLDEKGARLRDLPQLSGVSKESIAMALGILRKAQLVTVTAQPKTVSPTEKGLAVRDACHRRGAAIEQRWQARFGATVIGAVTNSLAPLVGDGTAQGSPLFAGLQPHHDGWRAQVPKPQTLPHFPMVLHRGGFPDGS
jgi:DNA-binding MarR family transcriptional regulator